LTVWAAAAFAAQAAHLGAWGRTPGARAASARSSSEGWRGRQRRGHADL